MSLFEIVREDGVVVYQDVKTISNLENNFLFLCRFENNTQSYIVYYLDEHLTRTGRKKKYIPYKDDTTLREKMKIQGNQLLKTLIEKLVSENS